MAHDSTIANEPRNIMHSFANMAHWIAQAYTGRGMKHIIRAMGMRHPAKVTDMYLRGEAPEYIAAACLAIETIGV